MPRRRSVSKILTDYFGDTNHGATLPPSVPGAKRRRLNKEDAQWLEVAEALTYEAMEDWNERKIEISVQMVCREFLATYLEVSGGKAPSFWDTDRGDESWFQRFKYRYSITHQVSKNELSEEEKRAKLMPWLGTHHLLGTQDYLQINLDEIPMYESMKRGGTYVTEGATADTDVSFL